MIAAQQDNQTATAVTLPSTIRRIVLTGFMGAGKTTVGKLLAAQLGWEFLDLDAHLEARANTTIPEIFAQHGEAKFRRLESNALASALGHSQTVLALGGGTPEQLTNRLLLEQTPGTVIVFLDAPFPTLFDRCVLQDVTRPVLADPAQAEQRFAQRTPLYRRLAHHTLATADQTPEATAASLLEALSKPKASR